MHSVIKRLKGLAQDATAQRHMLYRCTGTRNSTCSNRSEIMSAMWLGEAIPGRGLMGWGYTRVYAGERAD